MASIGLQCCQTNGEEKNHGHFTTFTNIWSNGNILASRMQLSNIFVGQPYYMPQSTCHENTHLFQRLSNEWSAEKAMSKKKNCKWKLIFCNRHNSRPFDDYIDKLCTHPTRICTPDVMKSTRKSMCKVANTMCWDGKNTRTRIFYLIWWNSQEWMRSFRRYSAPDKRNFVAGMMHVQERVCWKREDREKGGIFWK